MAALGQDQPSGVSSLSATSIELRYDLRHRVGYGRWPRAAGADAEAEYQRELRIRAAQYLRMSTDHQQYSIACQREAIARYAEEHGLKVVRTYADEGKSGVSLQGREGLFCLLEDVARGRADFRTVLVYDVSRWGRFQDSDESAFYEFFCRRAGIEIVYCAEPFLNDGSPMSSVIKGMKRVMAGEYSRELSKKIFVAKCRGVRMGFHAGGPAPFGLRRAILGPDGQPVRTLEYGEHKYLQTDRVVMRPGPAPEQAMVRWMFRQVARYGQKPTAISRVLNNRGIKFPSGKRWNAERVRHLLHNQKYLGRMLYNRTSMKLKSPKVANPAQEWLQIEDAFPAIVPRSLFARAHAVIAGWSTRITNEAAIEKLRALYERTGTLTSRLIDATEGMPGSAFYDYRFGGLNHAYALVGFKPKRSYDYLKGYAARRRRQTVLREEVARELRERGAAVEWESKVVLAIDGRIRMAVLLAPWRPRHGASRWRAQVHVRPRPDWALLACLNAAEDAVEAYHLASQCSWCMEVGARDRIPRERHTANEVAPLLDLVASRRHRASDGGTATPHSGGCSGG